jgi:acetoin utilization deacetylase AcuC-like enzyme
LIFSHPVFLQHDPGPGHPESPQRLEAVLEALADPRFAALPRREAPRASRSQIAAVHGSELIELLESHAPRAGRIRLDPDTAMSPDSLDAALRAAGAVCSAVDSVIAGPGRRAFCAVRPPGHHATRDQAMGFCLLNSVAIGARHAQRAYGIERIVIVDFDVHHGNGTQDVFWDDPGVMYASSHQFPLYPGTGRAAENGRSGTVVNAELPPGTGSKDFRIAWRELVLPAIIAFKPQLVLVSAGFDAHRLDPLANLDLETGDYGWITRELVDIAERFSLGRIVSSLEGGYSLTALRESTRAHCAALFGLEAPAPAA